MNRTQPTMFAARMLLVLVMLMAPVTMLWAQEGKGKFSMTTQLFLHELKKQSNNSRHPSPRRPNDQSPNLPNDQPPRRPAPRRLIARPDTVGGVAYISCFIHLNDVARLDEVQALGVEIEETFDGQDFVTARVPVGQLEPLAALDNVTLVKVARQMRPLTDTSRQLTNVDDVLTPSADATALGVTGQYDGTGVMLGIIDTGIDFQHIAFKDSKGNSRIRQAYVYTGTGMGKEYTAVASQSLTTDDETEDHGTHTATTAGGSSVIVDGNNITVTDDHARATYGGMAPGADLYLAGIYGLTDTYVVAALKKMVAHADQHGQPLVVSNSWGSGVGPHNGTGEWASLVSQYFGDGHPNHIILFAASNDAGHRTGDEEGGFFVKKDAASSDSPLATVLRTDGVGGDYYAGLMACAWAARQLACTLYVLDNTTGAVLDSWTVTSGNTSEFSGLDTYYSGSLNICFGEDHGGRQLLVYTDDAMESTVSGAYTLAIEVWPVSTANVKMWAGDWSYFTGHLTTEEHSWTAGTDDMSVSDEATIPNAISVGAYVSKDRITNYQGRHFTYDSGPLGDIACFSSYATAEQSPTGQAYPWITAPGAQVVAGVNHYHTASVDNNSYYHSDNAPGLVVNSADSPYGVMQGTSMATPVAAGIVALWLQASMDEHAVHKDLTVNDVKTIMERTAITDSYTSGPNASHFGKGKIDALAGIEYILKGADESDAVVVAGQKLFYESISGYMSQDDSRNELKNYSTYLDDRNWSSFTKVYAGGEGNAWGNGGCLKLGTSSASGAMTSGDIGLTGGGRLTFYLKKYDSDTGKLNVTVEGATADVTQFTPSTNWTLCTVNLSQGNGEVTVTLATSSNRAYVDEITVTTNDRILFSDNGNNTDVISAAADGRYDVSLNGRTLYKDGAWNTLCLPFDVRIADSPLKGDGVTAMTLNTATSNLDDGTLTLNFEAVSTLGTQGGLIPAGTPFIIKWKNTEDTEDIVTPVFKDVAIAETSAVPASFTGGTFTGTFDCTKYTTENKSILFLGSNNTLYWPQPALTIPNAPYDATDNPYVPVTIGAFRAYFDLGASPSPSGGGEGVRQVVLNFGDGNGSAGVSPAFVADGDVHAPSWYTVSGVKLDKKPMRDGLYIHNGKMVVIRSGMPLGSSKK